MDSRDKHHGGDGQETSRSAFCWSIPEQPPQRFDAEAPRAGNSSNYNQVVYTNRATDPDRVEPSGPSTAVLQQPTSRRDVLRELTRDARPPPDRDDDRSHQDCGQPPIFSVLVNNRSPYPRSRAHCGGIESGPPAGRSSSDSIDNPIALHQTQAGHTGDVTTSVPKSVIGTPSTSWLPRLVEVWIISTSGNRRSRRASKPVVENQRR